MVVNEGLPDRLAVRRNAYLVTAGGSRTVRRGVGVSPPARKISDDGAVTLM